MARSLTAYGDNDYKVAVSCVAARPRTNTVSLRFEVSGTGLEDVLGLGAGSGIGGRVDGLWERTCMEAFVRPVSGEASESRPYFELNVQPPRAQGCWQCYRFDSYREGRTTPESVDMTKVSAQWSCDSHGFCTWILESEAELPGEAAGWAAWEVFPTAIVQGVERPENKFYEAFWSLAHADGDPDFHKMFSKAAIILDAPPSATLSFLSGRHIQVEIKAGDTIETLAQQAAVELATPVETIIISSGEHLLSLSESAEVVKGLTISVTARAPSSRDQMLKVFNAIDADASGSIDFNEWREALKRVDIEMTGIMLQTLICNSDSNGSGTIDFNEFVKMMQSNSLRRYGDFTLPEIRSKLLSKFG